MVFRAGYYSLGGYSPHPRLARLAWRQATEVRRAALTLGSDVPGGRRGHRNLDLRGYNSLNTSFLLPLAPRKPTPLGSSLELHWETRAVGPHGSNTPGTELPPIKWKRASLSPLPWNSEKEISYEDAKGKHQWRASCGHRSCLHPLRVWSPAPPLPRCLSGRREILAQTDRFVHLMDYCLCRRNSSLVPWEATRCQLP